MDSGWGDQAPRDALAGAVVGVLDHAAAVLSPGGAGEGEDPVHEARKSLKFARALQRLARDAADAGPGGSTHPSLGAEMDRLKGLAARLAPYRDAAVLVEAVALPPLDPDREVEARLRHVLEGRLRARAAAVTRRLGDPSSLVPALRAAADAAPTSIPGALAPTGLGTALLRTEAKARRTMLRATAPGGGADDHHRWRKRAKDLRHQLEFLGGLAPAVPATPDALHHLGDLLGHANDLVMLHRALAEEPGLAEGLDGLDDLHSRLRSRVEELWREAAEVGTPLF